KLGRFITADPIVQAPYNPQTLNRYTYCNNNPINLVDPTGRSWKSFFKAITDTVKYVINPVKWDPLINGVVTGDWSYAKQMVIAGTTGFIFGGPIGAATAMFTTAVMRTPIAQWTIENYGHYYFDNVLGMRPGTAYVWSYLTISTGVSLGTEAMLASSGGAQPAQKRKLTPDEKEYLRQNGNFAGDENRYGSSLKTKAFDGPDDNVWGLSLKDGLRASYQDTPLTVPGLQQMGALHSSANVIGIQAQTINPWSYAFWGTCHQATNVSLLQGGISYTLMDLSGNWSMAVTTAVYGNYGGQLPSRIYSGVQAYNDYDES
ncbi:MAG: hypothetical protein HGA87_04530, partial [Desulfobulbaceae bacterium]|nr:hypothetical protein [Desulfobulbaceae bacterium]